MKKFLSIILSLVFLASFTINVCAMDTTDDSEGNIIITELQNDGVTPRLNYLSLVTASIDKRALGFVSCASTYSCVQAGYTITLTCTLQRTEGGSSGWVRYKLTSDSFSSGSAHGIEETWFAPGGYAYRTYTTVIVRNASGGVVETATCYSPTLYK